jgi:hypothetical protein
MILPQPIERQDFHKRLQEMQAGGKRWERWTMKRRQQERNISKALPHNSEL